MTSLIVHTSELAKKQVHVVETKKSNVLMLKQLTKTPNQLIYKHTFK